MLWSIQTVIDYVVIDSIVIDYVVIDSIVIDYVVIDSSCNRLCCDRFNCDRLWSDRSIDNVHDRLMWSIYLTISITIPILAIDTRPISGGKPTFDRSRSCWKDLTIDPTTSTRSMSKHDHKRSCPPRSLTKIDLGCVAGDRPTTTDWTFPGSSLTWLPYDDFPGARGTVVVDLPTATGPYSPPGGVVNPDLLSLKTDVNSFRSPSNCFFPV